MADAERDLLMDLGEVIQLLDDHHDVGLDGVAGLSTSTILGESTLAQLAGKIRELHVRLGGYYGRARVRGLAAALYLVLVGALFADRDTGGDHATQRRRTTAALLFAPAGNLVR